MKDKILIGGVVAIGAASWWYVGAVTGRREAWDSEMYFAAALPALAVFIAALAAVVPARPWRWAVAPFAGQAGAAFIRDPAANLLPLGLIVFAFFAALCLVPAYAGAFAGRLVRRVAGRPAP
jgi:hypothetical protein